MSEESESLFLPEDGPADAGDIEIGKALEEAAAQVAGAGGPSDGSPAEDGGLLDDLPGSGGAIDQIGQILGDVFTEIENKANYAHDVDDEPPPRTGPHPAGGPS